MNLDEEYKEKLGELMKRYYPGNCRTLKQAVDGLERTILMKESIGLSFEILQLQYQIDEVLGNGK